jgi:hypothetical protein
MVMGCEADQVDDYAAKETHGQKKTDNKKFDGYVRAPRQVPIQVSASILNSPLKRKSSSAKPGVNEFGI